MRKFLSNEELMREFLKGTEQLYQFVSSTLGPCGNNVIIHLKEQKPITTKDGATVAKNMHLENKFQNVGVQILKEASLNTEKSAGDGTTTSTILAFSIFREALKYVAAGMNVYELQKGIEKAVEQLSNKLSEIAIPIKNKEDLKRIATISANGDTVIGNIIANAIEAIGRDGSVVVENSNSVQTILSLVEGFRMPSGFLSPYFVTDERRGIVKYDNPLILITDSKIEVVDEIFPVLEIVARENKPLVIVADSFSEQVLNLLVLNAVKNTLKICAINAPKFGEEKRSIMKDLAISTGGSFVSQENGLKLKDVKLKNLGSCRTAEIQRYASVFLEGKGNVEEIEGRIEVIKNEIVEEKDIDRCKSLQERISRLSSGVAVIKVGGSSEIEVQEKKFRIDDALEAVRSAQQGGVCAGGGVTFLRLSEQMNDEECHTQEQKNGFKIVQEAIKAPFYKIMENANENAEKIIVQLKEGIVYDVRERKFVEDGEIIDPIKVLKMALLNASSVAIALLTTKNAIVEE